MRIAPTFCAFLSVTCPLVLATSTHARTDISVSTHAERDALTSPAAISLARALEAAGANRAELEKALAGVPDAQRASLEWLIAHMPEADLRELKAVFLLTHVDGAYNAWKSAPWSAMVDEATYFDAILPYASVSEKRELWMPLLRPKCLPMVEGLRDPALAAARLNQRVFPEFKVQYSTKRKRADQSPSESIESGLASCSGLSILLIDACRSVGIPARFVGVPMWTDGSGNHSWIEIWDGTRWRYTGAAEPTGDELDQGWFSGRASGQNRSKPEHAIYAVTWRETGVEFPFVFDRSRPRARAVDVTDRYAGQSAAIPEGMQVMRISVRDPQTKLRVSRAVEARDQASGSVAKGVSKDERFDLNDHLELIVPKEGMIAFAIDGVLVEKASFVRSGGEIREVILEAPATTPATTPATSTAPASTPTSVPGAVSGRFSAAFDDSDFFIDAAFMPAEVIAPAARGDEKSEKPNSTTAIKGLQAFLKDGTVADVAAQPFASTTLDTAPTSKELERVTTLLTKALESEVRKNDQKEFESKTLVAVDGTKMPFWYAVYGEKPKTGRSLYISMHGGGGAPPQVNTQQWENQKRLYKPEEGVYVAPRAPTDTWNLWHQGHIDELFRELIRDMIVFEDVDPNRVYLMGYSAGGDGVYQLAPRMADSFAAAAMMAGHPNETRPDGLRNIPFALYMGGKDAAFSRNDIARSWKTTLADLAAKDPGGYTHEVTIYEENGHWMDRKDAVAVPWMAKFSRNLRPERIVWLQDDVTSPRFYWLANPEPKGGQRVVAERKGQSITILEATGVTKLAIRLDSSMVDLTKPVTVKAGPDLGGATLFEGVVPTTIATMAKTLAERSDPSAIFPAEVVVQMPAASPAATPANPATP
jgi:predicted esterase